MAGILGPITSGRIALALGTVGVGALVGGAVADHRDADVGRGMLVGGLSAAAAVALLLGGAHAWQRFTAARTGAVAGAAELGAGMRSLPGVRFTLPVAPVVGPGAASNAPTAAAVVRATRQLPSAASLFATVTAPIPARVATPRLPPAPLAASGGTFIDALRGFLR